MFTLNCKGRLVVLEQPVVMGIINTTPDSFYSGSRAGSHVLERAEQMISDGALILDMGGQSTRPGGERVSQEEELRRVLPAIEAVHNRFPGQLISIDTFYARVAREAIAAGASIINDVSAGTLDENMIPAVADLQVPYILMHMKCDPQTMQQNAVYDDVCLEVFDALNRKLHALQEEGIRDILIDPGFGFAKTAEHNFRLLDQLSYFRELNRPLVVGLSRKATIYKTLGIGPEEALNGTTVLHTIALLKGADILRVHDVKEAVEAIKLIQAYKEKEQR